MDIVSLRFDILAITARDSKYVIMTENEISKVVLDLSIKIHKILGPGLLESAYEDCLEYELKKVGLHVRRQVLIPLIYDGVTLGDGFRADLIVNDKVLVELKSVKDLQDIHYAQTITYLKLTGLKLGLLINFNCMQVSKQFKRVVNGLNE